MTTVQHFVLMLLCLHHVHQAFHRRCLHHLLLHLHPQTALHLKNCHFLAVEDLEFGQFHIANDLLFPPCLALLSDYFI